MCKVTMTKTITRQVVANSIEILEVHAKFWRKPMSYNQLCKLVLDRSARSAIASQLAAAIGNECLARGLPLYNALLVPEKDKTAAASAQGWYNWAREQGVTVGDALASDEYALEAKAAEQRRCYARN